MESEYKILNYLQDNELTSQRKISKHTGLSLGTVNILIKKMARKGLVKIEHLNARTVRYILTPRGISEKAGLTYNFVSISYQQIVKITKAIKIRLQEKEAASIQGPSVLYGPDDEVKEILRGIFLNMNITPKIIQPFNNSFKAEPHQIVITWRCEDEELLSTADNQVVNILNRI